MTMKKSLAVMTASLGLLSACANQETTRTGFLNNYEQMQTNEKGVLKYSNTHAQSNYTAFMVDEVKYSQGSKGEELSAEQIAALKIAYRDAVIKDFSGKYALVTSPASNVMRVRLAITGVSKSIAPLNYVATVAILTPVSNGGISTESEIVDSMTGERLSALSTHTNPDIFDGEFTGYFTQTGHAKSVLEGHATQLRETLASR
jgi:Protein of unknown function (DUF3313)